MRSVVLAIPLAACSRVDPPPPTEPAVAPAPPRADKAETDTLAIQLVETTASAACSLFVTSSRAGLLSEATVPLARVSWTIGKNWENRTTLTAKCATEGCISGRQQGRTLDIPHTYFWDHREHDETMLFVARDVDAAKLVAALERIGRLCATQP